jgi:hypothetical protein
MTSLFNAIVGRVTNITNFSSIPNGVTAITSDSTTALATTAYVQANYATISPSVYLTPDTDQTLTGSSLYFDEQQKVGNIDTIGIGDTLQIGNAGDANLFLGGTLANFKLYIKTYLQPVTNNWSFWSISNTNVTPAGTGVSLTSVAVPCKKMLSGSFVIASTATDIIFTPNFTSKPVVILTIRSTAGTEVFQTKWVTGVNTAGFTANTLTTSPTLVMNWIAFGD